MGEIGARKSKLLISKEDESKKKNVNSLVSATLSL